MSLNGVRQWPVMSLSTLFIHGCARTTANTFIRSCCGNSGLCALASPRYSRLHLSCRDVERPRWVRSTLQTGPTACIPCEGLQLQSIAFSIPGAITEKTFPPKTGRMFPFVYWSRTPLMPAERLNLTKLFAFFLHKPEVFLR